VTEEVKAAVSVADDEGHLHPADDDLAELEVVAARGPWWPDGARPGTTLVTVYHGGDEGQPLARRVYDSFVDRTDWDLLLESDDAEDTLASRITARA
jgi:hypothetical protein